MVLRYSRSQQSQAFKSRGLEDQDVGNFWLMILSSPKWRPSNCFMQRAMCGGAPSCINTVLVSLLLGGTTDTESPACNFRQLDLLDSLTCILASIGCENTSRTWSTVIRLHIFNNRIFDFTFPGGSRQGGHHIEHIL